MGTIEERAKEYAPETFLSTLKRKAYIAGAQEQKAIDDAECVNKVLMGNGISINHYKQ